MLAIVAPLFCQRIAVRQKGGTNETLSAGVHNVVRCIIAFFIGHAVGAHGETDAGSSPTTNTVSTVLIAEKAVVPLGDPIRVSVMVVYRGQQKTTVEKADAIFDCFEVVDAQGQTLPYVSSFGFAQVISQPIDVQPLSTVEIVHSLDLTDQYPFRKTGLYSIRFKGYGWGAESSTIHPPPSSAITLDVTQGQLPELDRIAASLLSTLPSGWTLFKSARHEGLVVYMGRHYRGGETVFLGFSPIKAAINTPQKTDPITEYLGDTQVLHVYLTRGTRADALWPKAVADISRVLKIVRE